MVGRKKDQPSREASADKSAAGMGETHDLCPFCGSAAGGGAAVRLGASRNRQLQVTRSGGRKLFGKERKETFLQWFAATGNLGFAAAQAGVTRQTVSKHRLTDPAFEAAYAQAVMLCVPDLQARLHAHVLGSPRLDAAGGLAPPDEKQFDPQLAIQILRELQRYHAGMGTGASARAGQGLKRGRRPRTATNAEIKAALVKRLAVFGARVAAEEGLSGSPPSGGE